jgi:FKBP-type peptidyl-prolyl cis-trans isomerase
MSAEGKEAPAKKDMSYSMGYRMGMDMTRQFDFLKSKGEVVDVESFLKGMTDSVKKAKPTLTQEQMMQELQGLNSRMQAGAQATQAASGEDNAKAGAAFLAANGKKKGVTTTASGLQYLVLAQGKGAKPKATDKVKVHYKGTLLDGTVFDSSYDRGQPTTFPANRVIKGWTEALQLMNVGSKYKLFIPGDLAYGPGGAGGKIGPNATLVFEVELLEIVQ